MLKQVHYTCKARGGGGGGSILIRFTEMPSTCPLAFPFIYFGARHFSGILKDYVKHRPKN